MALAVSMLALMPEVAQAQSNEELQRQINELKAQIQALTSALANNGGRGSASASNAASPAPSASAPAPAPVAVAAAPGQPVVTQTAAPEKKSAVAARLHADALQRLPVGG